jgi:uncharacterized protein
MEAVNFEQFDVNVLQKLTTMNMPFGKYQGQVLSDLPEYYLEWFYKKGFPKGRLGMLLETLYEIKLNGLEFLLKPLNG